MNRSIWTAVGVWLCLLHVVSPPLASQETYVSAPGGVLRVEQQCGDTPRDGPRRLGGEVRDLLTSTPVANVKLFLKGEGADPRQWMAVTDSTGQYFFCLLHGVERATVTATSETGLSKEFDIDVQASTWARPVYMRAIQPASLIGIVTADPDGNPVENATVSAEALGVHTRSAEDGSFLLHGIAGPVDLRIEHPDVGSRSVSIWMDGGFEYGADIELRGDGQHAPITFLRGTTPVAPSSDGRPDRFQPRGPTAAGRAALALSAEDWEARSVTPGRAITVAARGLTIAEGTLTSVGADALVIQEGSRQWIVPLEGIESVSVKTRNSKRLALMMGAFSAGLGAVVGRIFLRKKDMCFPTPVSAPPGTAITKTSDGEFCTTVPYGMVNGGLRAGVVGAGFGFLAGTVTLRWEKVF